MRFNYRFHKLCGCCYKCGNIIFTPDGNNLISPVGNRLTVFDLVNNTSRTLSFEARKNIYRIAIDPKGALLVVADVDGYGLLINFHKEAVLHRFNFKKRAKDITFSPCGKFLAVSYGNHVRIWETPELAKSFSSLVLYRTLTGHHEPVTCLSWSKDSKYLITGSKDMSSRVFPVLKEISDIPKVTLTGHRARIVFAYFIKYKYEDDPSIITIAKDGALFVWKWKWDDPSHKQKELDINHGKWLLAKKHYLSIDGAKIKTVAVKDEDLLLVGFNNGTFTLFEAVSMEPLQTLSISQQKLSTAAMNRDGEWLALGSAELGQLLVWEWQSETYVLKQQGHFYDLNIAAYSADGRLIATGGDDSKVKLWSTYSGFCFVTFSEHEGPVTGVAFVGGGNAVVSSSLDGTVRAFDLVRYRNFRTLLTPQAAQLTCIAIDGEGEIVCAGGMDPPEIYVWSLQKGNLLDVLAGHEGPISGLSFSSSQPILVSSSWDRTVKVWEPYKSTTAIESFEHNSDVLAIAFRPDGKEICSTCLDGQLYFWDIETGKHRSTIEGRRDIAGGRRSNDRRSATNAAHNKYFTSVSYTADGSCVIAGGRSKYICIYEVSQKILLKRFQLSHNRSLEGVLDKLNSKLMTEAGPTNTFDLTDSDSDFDYENRFALPGTKRGDLAKRSTPEEIRCKTVHFSPTGQEWAATSTEGLIIFSQDDSLVFDPVGITEEVTPESIQETAGKGQLGKALLMSLHLGEMNIILQVFRAIPPDEVELTAKSIPAVYIDKMLKIVATELETQPSIEYNLQWSLALLSSQGHLLRLNPTHYLSAFRAIQKALTKQKDSLLQICEENQYLIEAIGDFQDSKEVPDSSIVE